VLNAFWHDDIKNCYELDRQFKDFLILAIHGSEIVGLMLQPLYPGLVGLRVGFNVAVGIKCFVLTRNLSPTP
jgi:hypothetical protein